MPPRFERSSNLARNCRLGCACIDDDGPRRKVLDEASRADGYLSDRAGARQREKVRFALRRRLGERARLPCSVDGRAPSRIDVVYDEVKALPKVARHVRAHHSETDACNSRHVPLLVGYGVIR